MNFKRLRNKCKMEKLLKGCFLFVMILFWCYPTLASANTLKGQVTTAYGQTPVSGTTVQVIDIGSGIIHIRTTDYNGNYTFEPLPTGEYYLAYTHPTGTDMYVPGVTDVTMADHFLMTGGITTIVDFDLYSQLPYMDIWPGNNSVGEANIVGNPTAFSFTFDNAGLSLSELDISTFKITFDGLDITSFFLQLPPQNFLVKNNKLVINLSDIELPAGIHTISVEVGNTGESIASISRQISVQASHGYQIGFHMPPVEDWLSPFDDWAVELNSVNETFERHNTLVGYFTSWADAEGMYTEFNDFLNDQISSIGAVPVITWEPWQAEGGTEQPDYSLDSILQGTHDAYIEQFALDVLSFDKLVVLRLMHEFNGVYYPWAGANNNNDPGKFILVFQYIVNIFKNAGANNAQFMWSPNYTADSRVPAPSNDIEAYYPGDDYVDWIGVSGYNWGSNPLMQAQGWLSFMEIFNGSQFGSFLSAMAVAHPSKKVIIAEIGCNNDSAYSKADWITEAYESMSGFDNIAGVVWFNNTAFHDVAGLEADFRVMANSGDTTAVDAEIMHAYKNAVN
jgi:beta-mannanase